MRSKCAGVQNAASVVFVSLFCGCGGETQNSRPVDPAASQVGAVLTLASSDFADGDPLAERFTEDGDDLSPSLAWSGAPAETKSFALICDDPDAPSASNPGPEPWVHWVLYNIPADVTELPAGTDLAEIPGLQEGRNSWPSDNVGYRGPAPPPDSGPHRYFFKLYALDTTLEFAAEPTKQELLDAMSGHILGQGQLVGVYER